MAQKWIIIFMRYSLLSSRFFVYVPCCIIYSCSQLAREEKIPVKDTIISKSANTDSLRQDSTVPPGAIYANETDTSILLHNGEAFLKGHISPKSSPRKYTLTAMEGQAIIATVRPLQKNGNVRISQLQLPDKSFDGPFGDSVRYVTKTPGNFTIIIGQNMMAGDPWTGSFVLHVIIK